MRSKVARTLIPFVAITLIPLTLVGAEPEPGLYLRTAYAFGNLDISTVYIGAGRKIAINPRNGVDPFDFQAAARTAPKSVGTFTVAGNTMSVTWTGQSAPVNLPIEFEDGKFSAYDGGLVTRADAYGKNQRLNATYGGSAMTANVSAARTLTLTPSGSYTMSTLGGVSRIPGAPGIAEGTEKGTYRLSGNTLTLTPSSGPVSKHTVLPFNTALDPKKAQLSDDHMIFDGQNLKREK